MMAYSDSSALCVWILTADATYATKQYQTHNLYGNTNNGTMNLSLVNVAGVGNNGKRPASIY